MSAPDPRWLELLKASGWQTFAISAASGLFLLAAGRGLLPKPPEWATLLAAFAFLLCGALTFTSFVSGTLRFFSARERIVFWYHRYAEKRELREYLPHMTDEERSIIAYLLAHDQKTIVAAQDGGHAMTLISRGFLVPALRANQVFSALHCPFLVPDHLWQVLVAHRAEFPYKPAPNEPESHPWRKSWMA